MITHKVEKTLAEISESGSNAKRLCLVSWNGNPAKLDLRIWRTDEEPPKPARGITLTDDEAAILAAALDAYLSGGGE